MFKQKYLLFLIITIFGCNTEPTICPDNKIPNLHIAFGQLNDEDTVNFMGIIINDPDNILANNEELNDTLYYYYNYPELVGIPLNNEVDSITIILDFLFDSQADSIFAPTYKKTDTLIIKYSTEIILENLECDFFMEYNIDTNAIRVSQNEIDSVVYKSKLVDDNQETNIEIYF